MTKGEIIRAYKDRPNAKTIQDLADKNGMAANEIRKILHDAGEDVAVFGPGRPKKTQIEEPEAGKRKEADETIKDESENQRIKDESDFEKKPAEVTSDLPEEVAELVRARIAEINRQIQVYVEQVDALNNERNVLVEFMKN